MSDWKRQQNLASRPLDLRGDPQGEAGAADRRHTSCRPTRRTTRARAYDLWMKEDLLDAIAVSMYAADITDATRNKAIALIGRQDATG